MTELWKDIPNTEYSVSNQGRVASRKYGKWRILKPRPDNRGYFRVAIRTESRPKNRRVHQLVAEAFLPPKPTPMHQINHRDGIKTNNYDTNLEWVTAGENTRHSFAVLGKKTPHGEAHGNSKVTETEVREIRKRRAAGEHLKTIADDYGIGKANVGHIVSRRNWAWL